MKLTLVRNIKNFLKHCRLSLENFVQLFFQTLSIKARLQVAFRKIKEETNEHITHLGSTLKHVVLPLSIGYLGLGFFLGNNVIDSLFLSILVFVYSNFLPDLLSPFRTRNRKEKNKDEKWFRKYALLFLAPIFIFLLFGNGIPAFKTTENFHNMKSLTAYSIFLFLLGLVFYGNIPFSSGRILEIFSLAMFGSIGYATHLKVDKIL